MERSSRERRTLKSGSSSKTTCHLSIRTDPLLWKHIKEQERTDDKTKIQEEILSLIAQHVKAVNRIYSNKLFEGTELYRNVQFEVQRIKINTHRACRPEHRGEKNLFCSGSIDVRIFLTFTLYRTMKHFAVKYHDLTGGTLEFACVDSAPDASAGVREKYKTYSETIGGVYQSTKRSLNTGIINFVNYNSHVLPMVSQFTLAHEIGHNFGSPYDYPSKSRPGGSDWNYIMFAAATSGHWPNNSKFSGFSVKNISFILGAIIHHTKNVNCFIDKWAMYAFRCNILGIDV